MSNDMLPNMDKENEKYVWKKEEKKKKQKQTSYWVPRSTSHHHILSIYQVSHDVGPIIFFSIVIVISTS